MTRPKALVAGKLFEELGVEVDCYVLGDKRRILSQRGILRAIRGKNDGADDGKLGRFLERLPKRFAGLALGPAIEFELPSGGAVAIGREAQFFVSLLKAYSSAFRAGELHPSQEKLALASIAIIEALAGVGMEALIDEATGYEPDKADPQLARERARLFERLFRTTELGERTTRWPSRLMSALARLYRVAYDGGRPPKALHCPFHLIYVMVLGTEAEQELRARNPDPASVRHHQVLSDKGTGILTKELEIVNLLAEQSRTKTEFWARMRAHYRGEGLQLGWV